MLSPINQTHAALQTTHLRAKHVEGIVMVLKIKLYDIWVCRRNGLFFPDCGGDINFNLKRNTRSIETGCSASFTSKPLVFSSYKEALGVNNESCSQLHCLPSTAWLRLLLGSCYKKYSRPHINKHAALSERKRNPPQYFWCSQRAHQLKK